MNEVIPGKTTLVKCLAGRLEPAGGAIFFDSALDTESEKAVKDNMAQLFKGRTSFVIAHRLSTIRDADLILVIEKGKLVEQGTHDELMARQGLYYYLSSQQLGL